MLFCVSLKNMEDQPMRKVSSFLTIGVILICTVLPAVVTLPLVQQRAHW